MFVACSLSATENSEMMDNVVLREMVNVGGYDRIGAMLPQTVKLLDEFYQPFINKLAQILQEDLFLWKDVYNSTYKEQG